MNFYTFKKKIFLRICLVHMTGIQNVICCTNELMLGSEQYYSNKLTIDNEHI